LERRLAGRNPTSKTLAKHADRTEFHCSRKLVTAARAGALGLRAHFPNHPTTTSAESGTALRREFSLAEPEGRRAHSAYAYFWD
jgi:hypothetical protein